MAVINDRLLRTRSMLDEWKIQSETPIDRIQCFTKILIMNRAKIKHHGCPVGTLNTELAKLNYPAKKHAKSCSPYSVRGCIDSLNFSVALTHRYAWNR